MKDRPRNEDINSSLFERMTKDLNLISSKLSSFATNMKNEDGNYISSALKVILPEIYNRYQEKKDYNPSDQQLDMLIKNVDSFLSQINRFNTPDHWVHKVMNEDGVSSAMTTLTQDLNTLKALRKAQHEKEESLEQSDPSLVFYHSLPDDLKKHSEIQKIQSEFYHYGHFFTDSDIRSRLNVNAGVATRLKLALLDMYQTSQQPQQELITALKNAKVLDENNQVNPNEINLMQVRFPFSFYYQKVRNELSKVKTDRFNIENDVYAPLLTATLNKPNEANKLVAMEQELLKIYYDIRKRQGMFSSRLGNALEHIIKDPERLNLVEKYNIRVPHAVAENDEAPDLSTAKHRPKRVALVPVELSDVDLTSGDETIYKNLSEKLKREYDEVVLVYNPDSVHVNVLALTNSLKENGLFVRVSPYSRQEKVALFNHDLQSIKPEIDIHEKPSYRNHYQKLAAHIQGENSDRGVEFSIFDNATKKLDAVSDLQLQSPAFYYHVNAEECHRYDVQKHEELQANVYHDIIGEFKKYNSTRREEETRSGSEYHSYFLFGSLFGRLFGSDAKTKTDATQKCIDYLEYKNGTIKKEDYLAEPFTDAEIEALTRPRDRLGKKFIASKLSMDEIKKDIEDIRELRKLSKFYHSK